MIVVHKNANEQYQVQLIIALQILTSFAGKLNSFQHYLCLFYNNRRDIILPFKKLSLDNDT